MFKHVLLSVWMLLLGTAVGYGQTTLIGPTTNNGGFENTTGTPWTISNGTQPSYWIIGTGADAGFSGTKSAYVTNNTTAPFGQNYDNSSNSTVHLYQDITFPAAQPVVNLSFKYKVTGETGWDRLLVYISNTATPTALVAGTPVSNTTTLTGYTLIQTVAQSSTWTTQNVTITPAQAGNVTAASNRRILFLWQNDDLFGSDPAIAIDDVVLTADCQGPTGLTATAVTTTSATLNWNAIAGATGYSVRYKKNSDPVTVATWATPTTVGAAITSLAITGLTALNTQYQFQVTATGPVCNNPSAIATFTTQCGIATLPYTEDFESITANNQFPFCMAATSVNPYVYTYIANQTNYNRINHTTGGSKFASFRYGADDWLFTPVVNLAAGSTYKFSFWYITDGLNGWDSLKVGMGNSQTAAGMTQQFTIATGVNNTTYQLATQNFTAPTTGLYSFGIKVKATFAPWYLTVDDINISELPVCAGTPPAEVISPSTSTVCPANAFTLTASGTTSNIGGVAYQWQSAPSATGPWTNIAGATNGNSYTQTGITASTYFRLQATCTVSAAMSTSNVATVMVSGFLNCYCTSGATNTADTDIGQVSVGSTSNPAGSPVLSNNPDAVELYTDFTTTVPAFQLAKGAPIPVQVTQITSGSSTYGATLKVYIDYNKNGSFTDPGELVFSPPGTAFTTTPTAPTFSGNFTVPASAFAGITRMRFVLDESGTASPCGTYSYGETEDYFVNITGAPLPPTLTSSGTPVCPGTNVTITATSNVPNPSYTLTGGGVPTTTNTTGIFNIITPSAGTSVTYSVLVTELGFVSTPATITVSLFPNTAISLGTVTNPSGCTTADGNIQITGASNSTVYTLRYRRSGVNVAPATITTTATGTYTITGLDVAVYDSIRIVNANGCVSNSVSAGLAAPSAPAPPSATYNTPLCLNTTATLSITNPVVGSTYQWIGPGSYTATGPVVNRTNVTYADTGTYSVTVTTGGCQSAPFNLKVYITPPSPQPATAPLTVCQGVPAAPLTATGVNLLFYTALTGGTGVSSLAPSTASVGTTTYYVTQTSNGCESRPRTAIVVTVNPTPVAPTVPNGGNIILCQFDTPVPLTASGVPGATFLFYTTATGGTGTPTLTPRTDTVGVLNYYVSQVLNGCPSPRAVYTVTVRAKPAPPVVVSPLNLCQYSIPAPLTAVGDNIKWYENPTGGVALLTAPTPRTDSAKTLVYYATQTVNGCESDRAQIQIIVNFQPNATFIPSKRFVCADDTISFIYYGNADASATYNWFIPKPSGTEISGQGTQGPFVARFDTVGVVRVSLIVTSKGCASTPVFQEFEVRDRPRTRINAKREICIDEVVEITLDSMSEQISNYQFTFDGGVVEYATYDAGPFGVRWTTPGAKQVIVNSTSRFCGSRTQAEVINVRPAPLAFIQNKPTGDICAGDSVRLQANDLGPGYMYTWTPANIFQNNANRGLTVFTTPVLRAIRYAAVLTVVDTVGCIGTDSAFLNTVPCCDVVFPNAFTPNNDGQNDEFKMISQGVPSRFTMRIMNRWGRVMYETSDARLGWDGRFDGEFQPTGTYFFYAKYRCANGEDYEQKGEITLIR